ncbi:hypothetical protein [Streptomyces sp. NPDC002788]
MSTDGPAGADAVASPARAGWNRLFQGSRRRARGLMLPVALTSFVTGITEPVEYSFLFASRGAVRDAPAADGGLDDYEWGLGVRDGFSFSAGLVDCVVHWNRRPSRGRSSRSVRVPRSSPA